MAIGVSGGGTPLPPKAEICPQCWASVLVKEDEEEEQPEGRRRRKLNFTDRGR